MPPSLIDKMRSALPAAHLISSFGITEADPIAAAGLDRMVKEYHKLGNYHPKRGYLAGPACHSVKVKVVDQFFIEKEVDCIGEILVSSPQVLTHYIDPKVTEKNKFWDAQGVLWHKTKNRGCLDREGNLWITGRIGDEVTCQTSKGTLTVDPYPVEITIDKIEGIRKSTLIQFHADYNPILFCELNYGTQSEPILKQISQALRQMSGITCFVHFIDRMPLSSHHSSNIDRHQLRKKALISKHRYLTHCYRGA